MTYFELPLLPELLVSELVLPELPLLGELELLDGADEPLEALPLRDLSY
jgi:hypothetical protein